jgi:hypothetical protein
MMHECPKLWTEVSWTAPTLGVWFPSLVARYEQWDRWLKQGRPKVFWLTGFFNPQGFITAMRQEISRKHTGWALDDVVVYNTVTKMEAEDVKDLHLKAFTSKDCSWTDVPGQRKKTSWLIPPLNNCSLHYPFCT